MNDPTMFSAIYITRDSAEKIKLGDTALRLQLASFITWCERQNHCGTNKDDYNKPILITKDENGSLTEFKF